MSLTVRHIDSDAALAQWAAHWRGAPLLALDTEFVRETTFYPIAGLVQLGDGEAQYLIDPLAVADWSPLRQLFSGPQPKVLHACGEDMEVFQLLLGQLPEPLFDTQVGAGLAGWGYGLGYGALVQQRLGITVEKEHTRSNWVGRPLTAEQCRYAALDVAHLPPLFDLLAEELTRRGRFDWWRQEGERALQQSRAILSPQSWYLKLGAGWRLQGAQLLFLRALCAWREVEARSRNLPRGRLLKDAECLELARRLPSDEAELARVPDLSPGRRQAAAELILQLAAEARASAPEQWPEPPVAPLPREAGWRLQRLRECVNARAVALDLAPELLARKRDLEELLRCRQLPPLLAQGWRRAVIGDELLLLANKI